MIVTLGKVVEACKSRDMLGISDRNTIISYIERAVEIAAYKANWNPVLDTLDICSDDKGFVTLPSFVGTVLSVNINGYPAMFRNSWYEFSVNGLGSYNCGPACGYSWDDKMWTSTFQQLKDWSLLAALCEDATDGNGSLELIVEGETMDGNLNQKMALTIPTTGASTPGVRLKLLNGYAATDPAVTYFKKITAVTKPVTRGYVKLLAFQPEQFSSAVQIGYYAPNETNPRYRRISIGQPCKCVRVRYRKSDMALVNDYDRVPLPSFQATLDLIKSIRYRETGNLDLAEIHETKAVQLMNEVQSIEDGPGFAPLQFDPNWIGASTIDFR